MYKKCFITSPPWKKLNTPMISIIKYSVVCCLIIFEFIVIEKQTAFFFLTSGSKINYGPWEFFNCILNSIRKGNVKTTYTLCTLMGFSWIFLSTILKNTVNRIIVYLVARCDPAKSVYRPHWPVDFGRRTSTPIFPNIWRTRTPARPARFVHLSSPLPGTVRPEFPYPVLDLQKYKTNEIQYSTRFL